MLDLPPDNQVLAVDEILRVVVPDCPEVEGLRINARRPARCSRRPRRMSDARHHALYAVVEQVEIARVLVETDGECRAVFFLDGENLLGNDVECLIPADPFPFPTAAPHLAHGEFDPIRTIDGSCIGKSLCTETPMCIRVGGVALDVFQNAAFDRR